jgi:hypothetical protein
VNIEDPDMPKKLELQSKHLYTGIQIAKVAWLRKAAAKEKSHSSLIVYFPKAEMANRVIEKGFIVEYEHLTAKLFDITH